MQPDLLFEDAEAAARDAFVEVVLMGGVDGGPDALVRAPFVEEFGVGDRGRELEVEVEVNVGAGAGVETVRIRRFFRGGEVGGEGREDEGVGEGFTG